MSFTFDKLKVYQKMIIADEVCKLTLTVRGTISSSPTSSTVQRCL